MKALLGPLRAERFEKLQQKWDLQAEADFYVLREVKRAPNNPHVARVVELLKLFRKAEELRLELHKSRGNYTLAKLQVVNVEFQKSLGDIDVRLRRYRWVPELHSSGFASLEQGYVWPKPEKEQWENRAVHWLLGLIDGSGSTSGRILRMRQCERCKTWFYALTDWAKFCPGALGRSSPCKKKFHAQSPEFKAKRARYMREKYRPLLKKRGDLEGRRKGR